MLFQFRILNLQLTLDNKVIWYNSDQYQSHDSLGNMIVIHFQCFSSSNLSPFRNQIMPTLERELVNGDAERANARVSLLRITVLCLLIVVSFSQSIALDQYLSKFFITHN